MWYISQLILLHLKYSYALPTYFVFLQRFVQSVVVDNKTLVSGFPTFYPFYHNYRGFFPCLTLFLFVTTSLYQHSHSKTSDSFIQVRFFYYSKHLCSFMVHGLHFLQNHTLKYMSMRIFWKDWDHDIWNFQKITCNCSSRPHDIIAQIQAVLKYQ